MSYPTGCIIPFTSDSIPIGWVLCDGSSYDASTDTSYQSLYNVIGNIYGGSANSDFQVPDLRGRVPLGKDNMGGTSANRVSDTEADSLGQSKGTETHTLTISEMPSHNHSGVVSSGSENAGDTLSYPFLSGNTGNKGGDDAHNNMPPVLTLNYIIKK